MNILVLTVNGVRRDVSAPQTVATLLAHESLRERRVAVEVNGELVPKSRHADTALASGDAVEIVVAVGGG